MNNFKLIQEHFTKIDCPICNFSFTQEGIKLIKQENDYWVIKLDCEKCNHSLGFAIVVIEYNDYNNNENTINNNPPITVDDVINAHKFIQELGSDWTKYLKKK
ncbi:MAG: hypothetical protein H7263_05920 [Candidatus Sericytochromatia bacterium]|nr:hypothetical protein [Candidatus Sericytochromatia bacterium]